MSSTPDEARKQVERDRQQGKTGFDADAYKQASSQTKNAIDTATNKK